MKWLVLKKVLKLHGSADRNYCMGCQRFYDLESFLALEGPVPTLPELWQGGQA